jgi:protein-disulfide isomerase
MTRLSRRTLLLAGLAAPVLPARAEEPEAQTIPIELVEEALELEAAVAVGSRSADVTLVEFFDYNCPWCRRSAADLPKLLAADPDLAYVLVNFAVLGAPSVQATRVALAFAQMRGPARYLDLHAALFAGRGVVDGARALAAAGALGAEPGALTRLADSERITRRMREALRVGESLGLAVTPSFVIGPRAYQGGLTLAQKQVLVAAARA